MIMRPLVDLSTPIIHSISTTLSLILQEMQLTTDSTLDVLEGLRMVLRSFQVHLRGSGIERKHIRQQICPVSWEQYC